MEIDPTWHWDNPGVGETLLDMGLGFGTNRTAFLLGARWMAAGWAVCEFLSDLAAQVNACPMCAGSRVKFGMTCPGCAGSGKYERPAYFHGRREAEFLPDELRKGKP